MFPKNNRSRWVVSWVAVVMLVGLTPAALTLDETVAEAAPAVVPAAVTIEPVADAQIDSVDPNTNFGSQPYFDVYGGGPNACVLPSGPTFGLLRFDLSTLPADVEVTGASLQLTSFAGHAVNGDGNHHIIDLGDATWDESSVTWATRPDDGTEAWANAAIHPGDPSLRAGGDLRDSAAALGSAFVFRNSCAVAAAEDRQIDFPTNDFDASRNRVEAVEDFGAAVEAARARGDQSMSVMVYNPSALISTNYTGYWARWHSREAADPALRPKLTLSFSRADLIQATPTSGGLAVAVRAVAEPNTSVTVGVVGGTGCVDGAIEAPRTIATITVAVDDTGSSYAAQTFPGVDPSVSHVVAQIDDPTTGQLSVPGGCAAVSPDNDVWTRALEIELFSGEIPDGTVFGFASGLVDRSGTARWFRVEVLPGATLEVRMSGPDEDLDLAVFRDIGKAFAELDDLGDLSQLGAEFAPSVFSPSVFSPSVFSPSVFSPDAFAPSVFSPSVFSPSVFSPSVFSPSVFSPSVFSPAGLAPSVFSEESFASAQTRSIVAVSANARTSDESATVQTWNNSGDYYIRVSGRNGAFEPDDEFYLDVVRRDLPECAGVSVPATTASTAQAGDYRTVIITDSSRLDGTRPGNTPAEVASMEASVATLAAHPDVDGVVVDLATNPVVQFLNDQADARPGCPYAKNLIADAVKSIIDGYRAVGAVEYVVIVGDDEIVPFFRYPDEALLGPESNYSPPVLDTSPSQAALRLNYVLGQDEYGSSRRVAAGSDVIPIPDIPVGRLVETASEIQGVVDAFLGLDGGVIAGPSDPLVTGYDFLTDTAESISASLAAGTGVAVEELITPSNVSPQDPLSWTASDLSDVLLGDRHDIMFLAGHFSANSALAADFQTSLLTTDLAASNVDLTNSLVVSAGCHSGYNIVSEAVIPGVTEPLDWAQAFAQKGATLIAGTGYQYGDTDFIEYSERLYDYFFDNLREGSGAVSIGDALIESKQEYLALTPDPRGLHRKSLIQATIFGLPMLSVDLPTGRVPDDVAAQSRTADPVTTDPGATLGLETIDEEIDAGQIIRRTVDLDDLEGGTVEATYFEGPDGVVTNPAEPALPLIVWDAEVDDAVLRGVGFRGGEYTDEVVVPLTGAPTTEIRGVHVPFVSDVFFPMRLVNVSHIGKLTGQGTRVLITPAQHRSIGGNESILRRFTTLDFRYYYSGNLDPVALSAPPTIEQVDATPVGDDVLLRVVVTGNPAAGIQEVWVTYTGDGPPRWAALDLQQCVPDGGSLPAGCSTEDSTIWVGTLVDAAASLDTLALIANAVNGLGLVTLQDSYGTYYNALESAAVAALEPTEVEIDFPTTNLTFGASVPVTARLTSNGQPVAGETIRIGFGATGRTAVTNAAGEATATININVIPGNATLQATFAGRALLAPSSDQIGVSVGKASTTLTLASVRPPSSTPAGVDLGLVATLVDANGAGMLDRTIFFELGGAASGIVTGRTDIFGRASIPRITAGEGIVTVRALFLPPTLPQAVVTATDATYKGSTSATVPVTVATHPGTAVLVTSRPVPPAGDVDLVALIDELGFDLVVVDDDTADLAGAVAAADPSVVLLSTSVVLSKVGTQLAGIPYPLVTWEAFLHDEMGLAERAGLSSESTPGPNITIVDPDHPTAAGLSRVVRVSRRSHSQSGLFPAGDGRTIAVATHQPARTVLAVWEAGDLTALGPAPARIVAIFPTYFSAGDLTAAGEELFRAAVSWAVGGDAPPPTNQPPVVDAGADQTVVLPNVSTTLAPTFGDDGLPTPASLTTTWSQVSGPAAVTFDDPDVAGTPIELPDVVGSYVLELAVDDGAATSVDTVTITVRPNVPEVVFVSNSTTPPPGDTLLLERVVASGATVRIVDDDDLATADLSGVSAVFVSTSVKISVVGALLRDVTIPIVMWEGYLFDDMGLGRSGESATKFNRIDIVDSADPLAAGLAGSAPVMTTTNRLSWARVSDDADVIAIEPGNPAHAVVWRYEAGDSLFDGTPAAGDRYGFFADYFGATRLNASGVAVFDAIIAAAVGL